MSLLGLEQLTNLLSEERSGDRRERMAKTFDAVTEATVDQLGKRTSSLYESGDRLQRETVDLMFDLSRPEELKPSKVVDRAADLVESTADALRDVAGEDKKKKKTTHKRTTSRRKTTAEAST
jgi:phenylpyruvate tautomerase PptA (4-oxalocrotonate tautomerase family)